MASRSAQPDDAGDHLAVSALAFAARCHSGQRRVSDGAPYIEHPVEVARLMRDHGCSEVLVAAALLHDVVERSPIALLELTARFGPEVADLVNAVTEDDSVESYPLRKQRLRERVDQAGVGAALLFAADKIAKVRELTSQAQSDRSRFPATPTGSRARASMEHDRRIRLDHYRASLDIVRDIAPGHPLVDRLEVELDSWPADA